MRRSFTFTAPMHAIAGAGMLITGWIWPGSPHLETIVIAYGFIALHYMHAFLKSYRAKQ